MKGESIFKNYQVCIMLANNKLTEVVGRYKFYIIRQSFLTLFYISGGVSLLITAVLFNTSDLRTNLALSRIDRDDPFRAEER